MDATHLAREFTRAQAFRPFGSIWVVTGPILNGGKPTRWIGEKNEIPIAIPDAFFKMVIKEGPTAKRPDVLTFIDPNVSIDRKASNHEKYLTSVDTIQKKTGLHFLQKLSAADQAAIESQKATALWK